MHCAPLGPVGFYLAVHVQILGHLDLVEVVLQITCDPLCTDQARIEPLHHSLKTATFRMRCSLACLRNLGGLLSLVLGRRSLLCHRLQIDLGHLGRFRRR